MPYSLAASGLRLTDFTTANDLALPAHSHHHPVLVLVRAGALEQDGLAAPLTQGGLRLAPAGSTHDVRLHAGTRLTIVECDPAGLVGSHPVWRRLRSAVLRPADTLSWPLAWARAPQGYPGGVSLELEDEILRLLSAEWRQLAGRQCRPVPAELIALYQSILNDPAAVVRPGALAATFGVHRVQLGRWAREFLGRPLWHLVMSARLNHARHYLLESSLAIARIAELSGFCDQSHLHRAFRRRFGASPGQFRRMYQASKISSGAIAILPG